MRFWRGSAVVLGLVLCASSSGSAQTADEQMKKDIEAPKEGQQAIQKDLAEIKRLLQSRPAAADALPKDPITGLEFGFGLEFSGDGDKVGEFDVVLLGIGPEPRSITIDGSVTGGVTVAGNVARFSGTATLDMGDGSPLLPGIPFTATVTTDANDQGSLGLVIGATTLPSAAVNEGTMTISAPAAP